MSAKIENIVEYVEFRRPDKRVAMLEIHYLTDKGYRGVIHMEKQGATKESISAAVMDAAKLPDELIGARITK